MKGYGLFNIEIRISTFRKNCYEPLSTAGALVIAQLWNLQFNGRREQIFCSRVTVLW